MESNTLVKGVVIGGLVGAGLGILFAPKSGKEMREEIRNSAQEVLEKAKTQFNEAVETLGEMKTQNMEMLQDKKDRLKKAIAAGTDAYKEVKNKEGCMSGLYGDNSLL